MRRPRRGSRARSRYLTRALEEPLEDEERGELLLELAGVEANLGAPNVIAHLRDAASLLREPDRQAEASLALGHALYWAGEEEQGVEVLERALAEQPNLDLELRHRLEAELVVNATRVSSQYERARERLAQLDLSLDEGPGARVLVAGQAYHEAVGGGDAEHAAATALAALTAMSDEERARNYTGGAYALLYADHLDEGIRLLDATLADVRRRGAVFHFSSLSMTRAIFQYARGALVEAEADGRAALEALPHREVWFRWAAHGWLAQILVERGAVEEAAGLIEAVEPTVPPDAFSRAPLLRAGALVEAARGDHPAALARALELGRAVTSFGHTNPPASFPAWRSLAALEHHALGETAEARTLAQEEVELARAWGAPRTLGRALRILGLIQGGDDGIALIREAVAVLEPSPARLEHAYALTNLGAALRRANHRAEARELPATSARTRSAERSDAPHPGGARGADRDRCETAAGRLERCRSVDAERAPDLSHGGRGPLQPRDRAGALRHPANGRNAPLQRLPQTRRVLPHAAPRGARGERSAGDCRYLTGTLRSFLRSPHVAVEGGSAHPRPIANDGGIEMTELAHRRNHDFDVALYWDTNRNELFVVVEDIAGGDRFSIAAPRARALDVFEHPFAYATPR